MRSRRNIILTVNILLLIVLILITKLIFAQQIRTVKFPERSFGVSISPSNHIKQGIRGLNVGLNHEIKLNKVLTLHNDFAVTMHTGTDPLFADSLGDMKKVLALDPDFMDKPLPFITGGIQTFVGLSANLLSGKLTIGAGPLVRYQTTTVPDKYSFFYEVRVGQFSTRYHTYYIIDRIHPHTLSAGALFFMDVKLINVNKLNIKATANYQLDSYRNTILSIGLKFQQSYTRARLFEHDPLPSGF